MLTKLILVILISLPSLFAQSVYNKTPRWYTNPPVRKGLVYGVGLGELKMEAIVIGLADLMSKYRLREATETVDYVVSSDFLNLITDNKFEFSSSSSSSYEENTDNSRYQFYGKLLYQGKSGSLASITYVMDEKSPDIKNENYSDIKVLYNNTDENKIIDELDGKNITVGIRPGTIKLADDGCALPLLFAEPLGNETILHLDAGENTMVAKMRGIDTTVLKDSVKIGFNTKKLCFFDSRTERQI